MRLMCNILSFKFIQTMEALNKENIIQTMEAWVVQLSLSHGFSFNFMTKNIAIGTKFDLFQEILFSSHVSQAVAMKIPIFTGGIS